MKVSTLILMCTCISLYGTQAAVFNPWQKSGQCPKVSTFKHCYQLCLFDVHCPGMEKCCTNRCGGTMCSKPYTPKVETPKTEPSPNLKGKHGSCPNPPTGPWVCSSRCKSDDNCIGTKKCCKNRCGAMACVDPVVEQTPPFQQEYVDSNEDYEYYDNNDNGVFASMS